MVLYIYFGPPLPFPVLKMVSWLELDFKVAFHGLSLFRYSHTCNDCGVQCVCSEILMICRQIATGCLRSINWCQRASNYVVSSHVFSNNWNNSLNYINKYGINNIYSNNWIQVKLLNDMVPRNRVSNNWNKWNKSLVKWLLKNNGFYYN